MTPAALLQSILASLPEIVVVAGACVLLILGQFVPKGRDISSSGPPSRSCWSPPRERSCSPARCGRLHGHVHRRPLRGLLQGRVLPGHRPDVPSFAAIRRDRRDREQRVLRPAALRAFGHDDHGLGDRPAVDLCRPRTDGALHLRADRLPAAAAAVERSGAEIRDPRWGLDRASSSTAFRWSTGSPARRSWTGWLRR